MKILLVDDEHELVSAMAERLDMRGIHAEFCCCGTDAIEMAKEKCFDVAVLDMKMPRMSGLELRRELSALCPDMRFVFLSGHGSEEDFKQGCAEAAFYLIKPVAIEDLMETLRRVMEK
ncbi:response regulator [Pseudodesulfovibrio senegalensis]|jgi:DNA-binding response OmpR family regulator|uniref:Response regulator n=1 Tax=Pseudodesulfovibrio senegalensis TaxID=1721087 RepID=A0A6N6N0F9_9BACT|nr:response regulator [Pseudodesulfovibrio senegalensis]KAB1441339.1 response regulator [Pseudodesulfovibrio senegalensis]